MDQFFSRISITHSASSRWEETHLYDFIGNGNGGQSEAGLVLTGGLLWGTTRLAGNASCQIDLFTGVRRGVLDPVTQKPVMDDLNHDDDEHESEWRLIIAFRGIKCSGPYKFPPELLEEVMLGCEMAPENQAEVVRWVRERNISRPRLYKARTKEAEFGLDFVSL